MAGVTVANRVVHTSVQPVRLPEANTGAEAGLIASLRAPQHGQRERHARHALSLGFNLNSG